MASPSAAYKVNQDGTVDIQNAPYPKSARYGDFPTPPLMRMPAPVVLLAPGQVQAPTWSLANASWADGRTAADEAEFPKDGACRWYIQQDRAGMATQQDAARQGVSATDYNALRANVTPALDWLSKQPNVSKPVGVCVIASNFGAYATPANPFMIDAGHAIRGHVMIGFWPAAQLRRRGDRVVSSGEISHLLMDINKLPSEGSRLSISDAAGEMFEEIPVTHTLQGFPVYRNTTMYIALNDRPLTRGVRTDRLLRWQIAEIDKQLVTARDEAARKAEQLARMESPEQRAENERIIALRAKASYGGDMAKARASFESERRDEMNRLRAQADASNPANPVQIMTTMRAAADQRLKTMSPQEAAAQGCLSSIVAGTVISDVLAVGDPHCVYRMEEANPDYYDRSAPRSKVQLVAISRFPFRTTDSRDDDGAYNLAFGVDWQAFARDGLGRK